MRSECIVVFREVLIVETIKLLLTYDIPRKTWQGALNFTIFIPRKAFPRRRIENVKW